MKKALVGFALSLATAMPALAGSVYVVVLEPSLQDGTLHSTEVWVANGGTAQKPFFSTFLAADTDGVQRKDAPASLPVPIGRTFLLSNVGSINAPNAGLLEIDTSETLSVEARLVSTSPVGLQTLTRAPVISSANLIPAKSVAQVLGLERDSARGNITNLGVVNLGQKAAQCEIRLYRNDGVQIAPTATVSLKPLSLRHFSDALGLVGQQRITDVRAQVSCDQAFYPFASEFVQATGEVVFMSPSLSGASTLVRPGGDTGGGTPPPSTGGSVLFQQNGTFHVAAVGNPKKIFSIPVSGELRLKRLIVDLDFTPGPWNREKIPGNHAIAWVYRGKFRSNSVCNVNAFGPNKFTVKMNQNVDMPAGATTSNEAGLSLEQGRQYHMHYVYDAETETVKTEISSGGTLLKSFTMDGTAENHVLTVPASGLIAEFGHYPGQEGPEIPSYGWAYANLKIEGVSY
jgi:hypothetical protein